MAKRQSALEDIVEIAAKLPWWVGVMLALVSYVIFHSMAGMEVVASKNLHDMGDSLGKERVRMFAMFGQYLIPFALLIGAGMSAYGRAKRRDLHSWVSTSNDAGILNDMTWQKFEMLVGEVFRWQGFTVRETGGAGPDGGVDMELTKDTEKFLVQCKQWRAFKVNVNTVRELYGVMAATHASGGYVVTSGEFTRDAVEFAKGRNIELIDKAKLMELIQGARQSLGSSRQSEPMRDHWHKPVAKSEEAGRSMTPACPLCGSAMTQRVAKRGDNVGKSFWGCTTFPRCRGTLPGI